MNNIMDSSILQLYSRGGIDSKFIGNDNSLFKPDEIIENIFYKNYDNEKPQVLNFNDILNINLNNKKDYLGKMYLKVKIPYFQMFKNKTTIDKNILDYNLNKIVYDNHECYLFLINSKYYLIPAFILKSKLNYKIRKIEFTDIKKYFNDTIEYYINDTEDIYFLSFENVNYINDIFPLLLTFSNDYNKYYFDYLVNNINNIQLNKPILTSSTYNKYIENIVKNKLFENYQKNNHNDNLTKYYNIITDEVKIYIENYFNNKPITDLNCDSYITSQYHNENSYESELIQYIEDSITKNSLILHYIINNLYSSVINSYTFYKKYLTSVVNYEYDVIIENNDINDINSLGGNLVNVYYPLYTLKLETDLSSEYYNLPVIFKRLPFNFTPTMRFRTLNNKEGTYRINNDLHTLTITDTTKYEETTLSILITTDNTKNDPVITNIITDNNINTELVENITKNLTNLDYNFNIDIKLFNDFKKFYFSFEQYIKTYLYNLNISQDQIKNIFINLKVFSDRFQKIFTEVVYDTNDNFNTALSQLSTNYPDIFEINTKPQDFYNIYLVCLHEFKNKISLSSKFSDTNFINIYYNKFVSFFYNRFIKISNIDNSIISNFNGLLFYFNIDTQFYTNKNNIRNSFEELFFKKSFIGYSNINPLLHFSHNIVKENVNEFYNNTNFVDNNINHCFNDFTIKNVYNFNSEYINFTFIDNKIEIPIKYFNLYYYKDNLTKFTINLTTENKNLNVNKYKIRDNLIVLELPINILKQGFKLTEIINISIPLVHLSNVSSLLINNTDYNQNNLPLNHLLTTDTNLLGIKNDNIRYEIFSKDNIINKFINQNNIYFDEEYNEDYSYFMHFKNKNDNNISIKITYKIDETFDSISYSYAMNNIDTMIDTISAKLNIQKDNILFKNLIIGKTTNNVIEFYFNIKTTIRYNVINTKLSSLSTSIKYYIDLSTSNIINATFVSINEINDNAIFKEISLVKNGVGYLIKDLNSNTLLIDYNNYENIYIDVIKLPITKNITINDNDCLYKIKDSYPFVFLNKTSDIYTTNETLFQTSNTIKDTSQNSPIKIVDIASDHIKMHVIGNISNLNSLNLEIYNNSYLPNFYNYTSNSDDDISIFGDFMFQKPIMFKIYSKSDELPLYLYYNIPKNKTSDFYESTEYFINNENINELYNINSNQLNRDIVLNKLYSTCFDKDALKENDNDILNYVLSNFDNTFTNDFKSNVIDIIEKSYDKYITSHLSVLDSIKKTNNYGKTTTQLFNNVIELNKFKTIGGNIEYSIDLENYDMSEYDYFSQFAITLYNNKHNKIDIKNDQIVISNLNSKYNITKELINYPWVSYSVKNKINDTVNNYLLNFNKFFKNQIKFCKDNNIVDQIINNNSESESTNIGQESDFNSRYINKVYNYDNTILDLVNTDIHKNYINKNINTIDITFKNEDDYIDEDTYVEAYYNNKKIPLKYDNNKYLTTEKINKSSGNIFYEENAINKNSNYKDIGFINIINNRIIKLNKINGSYNFIVLNNTIYNYPINDDKYKFYVNGTSNSGPSKGLSGYYYPLSTISYDNDHPHTFTEFPNITFYMPASNMNHNKSTTYIQYFDYSLVKIIDFNKINGIYGNAKSLTKSSTNVELSLTKTNFYCYKLKSENFETNLTTNSKYFFRINNEYSYGEYDGTCLNLIKNNEFTINENNTIYYVETELTNEQIFNKLINNNLNIPYKNDFIISDFIILDISYYNYYCNTNSDFLTFTSFILYFDSSTFSKNYNIYKNILGKIFFNLEKVDETLSVTIYKNIETTLPPIKVLNRIDVYNATNEINFIKNGGYLNINNTNYDINNLENISENDGNYRCYYLNNTYIKDKENYEDIFEKKKQVSNQITLDPYNKTLVTDKIILDKIEALEVNSNKYKISNIIDSSTQSTVYFNNYNEDKIELIIKDSSDNLFSRQIFYTNSENIFSYKYNDITNTETDNLKVIPTSDVSSNSVFLNKLVIDSSHSSETIVISSLNNNIQLEKIDNLNYNINLLNSDTLINDKLYIVYLKIESGLTEEMIIYRFMISDSYFSSNILYDSEKINEPIYISTSSIKHIDLEDTSLIFEFHDSFYLSKITNTRLSTLTSINYSSFYIRGNKYIQFNEINSNEVSIISNANKEKTILGEFNYWNYLNNVDINTINENSIIDDSLLLSYIDNNYLPIILMNGDEIHYRDIELSNNQVKLSNNVTFANTDIFIYPYLPIYVNKNINVEIVNQEYYIYCDNTNGMIFERNEIIKFGNNVLYVLYFSVLKKAYVCKLISNTFENFDGDGYYTYGKFNNFYDKNKFLINNEQTNLLKYLPVDNMVNGDYYIKNNKMNIYRGETLADSAFMINRGTYIDLLYYNNCFYYDSCRIKIVKNMRIYCNNKQIIVENVSNNKFTFTNSDNETFVNYKKYNFYVPKHIFQEKEILINDYVVNNIKNGFFIYEKNFYTVTDYKVSIKEFYGTILLYDADSLDIKHHFINPYIITSSDTEFKNNTNSIQVKMNINTDGNIYFYNDKFSSIQFKYVYFQKILVNGVLFNVTNIDNNIIYINNNKNNFPLKITSDYYEITISAYNINNIQFTSNRYKLSDNYNYNYPEYSNSINNLNILFYNDEYTNNYTYNYTENNLIKVTKNNKFIYLTNSNDINQIKNNNELWTKMNKQFYSDNFIRFNTDTYNDDNYSTYLNLQDLNLDIFDNVLIEEINNNNKFLHYVNISIVNNMMKISNDYQFENIEESVFYLHKVIPIRITNYNYIQILEPNIIKLREIINNNNLLEYKVFIKVIFSNKPSYNTETNLWKYSLTINSDINLDYIEYLYFKNHLNDIIKLNLVKEGTTYYFTSSYLFNEKDKTTHFYYTSTNFINTINYSELSSNQSYDLSKSELQSILTNDNINKYKSLNKCKLESDGNNYLFTLEGNNLTNIDLGIINGNYYLNNTNKINNFEISSNNKYILLLNSKLYDIEDLETINNYLYYRDVNLDDQYYMKQIEKTPSLPNMIQLINQNNIDLEFVINSLKPWEDWSLISLSNDTDFKQFVNNYEISYNGNNYSFPFNVSSYFTNNEVTDIKLFLKNTFEYRSHYFDTLAELHKVEIFLVNKISELINMGYFWVNINDNVNKIIQSYKSTSNWILYNNTLMKNYGDEKEIDRYPDLFTSGKRNYYLSNDYNIVINDDNINVSNNISSINSNVSLFLSHSKFNLNGTSFDKLIESIKKISNDRLKSNTFTNNDLICLNHKYPSILKFLINKQYNIFRDDDLNDLRNLNSVFNKIEYTQNINSNNSGYYIDNMFNEEFFGLKSHRRIKLNSFNEKDKYYITELLEKKLLFNNNVILTNSLHISPIFNYNINFDDNTSQILTSGSHYKIEYDGTNYNNEISRNNLNEITNPEIYSDSISFYSNELIKNNNIIVNVSDKYKIIDFVKNGSLYNLSISNINKITNDSEIYLNNYNKVKLLKVSSTHIQVLSNEIINNITDIRLIDLCKITSSSIESNKTFVVFSSNINNIFIDNKTYIEINNNLYMVFYENNRYYINANIDLKKNRLYRITRNITITNIDVKSLYISDVTIDKNIEQYFYFNQTDNNLDEINFINTKLNIKDTDLLDKNKLRIYYENNNLELNDEIKHSYRIRQSKYYDIENITNMNKYLYELDIDLSNKNKDNAVIKIGNYNIEILDVGTDKLNFYLTSNINVNDLNKLVLNIKYTYNLINVTKEDNKLSCDIPIDFQLNSLNNYYVNGNIDSTIEVVNNKLRISVNNINEIDLNSDITLVEEGIYNSGKFSIKKPVFNQLYEIDLVNNFNPKNKTINFDPCISIFSNKISGGSFNYLYYYNITITSNDITFNDNLYLIYNEKTYKVEIIMIQQDTINYNIKIGSNELFDESQVKIYTDNNLNNEIFVVTLKFSNMNTIKTKYYKNISNKKIQLYLNSSIDNYDSDNNITNNKYIYYTKYSDFNFNNNSYKNVGFNKFENDTNSIISNVVEYKDVQFIEEFVYKFFKSIEIVVNNKVIEKIDIDCLKVLYSFYNNKPGFIFLKKIFRLKRIGDNYEFNLVLPTFNTIRPSDYLPLHLLKNKKIILRLKTESLKNLIDKTQYSEYKIKDVPIPNIEFNFDFIDTLGYETIGSRISDKIKLVESIYPMNDIIIKKQNDYNTINLSGQVKEIFVLIKNQKTTTINNYDSWLSLYLTNYEKYKNQNKENTSIYEIDDYYIFRLANNEIKNNSNRVKQIKNHPILKNYDTKYIIYLDEKYLGYINENLNNLQLSYSNKFTILSLYFQNIYKNEQIKKKVKILDKIKFDLSGNNVNNNNIKDIDFYKRLVPYYNGNAIPDDYLVYSFSFNSKDEQPTGSYNFTKNNYLGIKTLLFNENNPLTIKLIIKKYVYLQLEQ